MSLREREGEGGGEREKARTRARYETLSLCRHYTKSAVMSFSCVCLHGSLYSCV